MLAQEKSPREGHPDALRPAHIHVLRVRSGWRVVSEVHPCTFETMADVLSATPAGLIRRPPPQRAGPLERRAHPARKSFQAKANAQASDSTRSREVCFALSAWMRCLYRAPAERRTGAVKPDRAMRRMRIVFRRHTDVPSKNQPPSADPEHMDVRRARSLGCPFSW